eukprot:jgi/Ulvmu1/8021/UM004_0258.1
MYRITIEATKRDDHANDDIPFSFGNPSVEHVTGILHLYRQDVSDAKQDGLPTSCTVCVLAVPADMAISELFTFFHHHMAQISAMRMVRREDVAKSICMSILDFVDEPSAHNFLNDFNGKPYSMLEPEILCKVVMVTSVEMQTPTSKVDPEVPLGHTELPTCPVCLERLDRHISGVITTVCNHKFHSECLQQWGDASCPVCRYCISSGHSSSCEACGTSADLWICLICGHVGCGRYKDAHACSHFEQTGHCYSLELETGRVWDYVSDQYVHRLIQSSLDGKLVEVPSPELAGASPADAAQAAGASAPTAGGSPALGSKGWGKANGAASSTGAQASEAALAMNEDMHMLEATHASKMDAVTREFTHLLTSQLESQRAWFEDLRAQDAAQSNARILELEAMAKRHEQEVGALQRRAAKAEGDAKALQKSVGEMTVHKKAARKELDVLTELNRSLISNQQTYKDMVAALQGQVKEKDASITDLREQVRDLMVFVEASQMAGKSEIAGGDVQVGPSAKPARRSRR